MSIVAGKDYTFYAFAGGFWYPYACARAGNFSLNTGMIESTGPGNGNYRTYLPEVHDFTIQLDGVVSLNETGNLTNADLLNIQLSKQKLLCRFNQTDQSGNTFNKQAYFYIQSFTDTGSFDGVATFSVTLRGTGLLTVDFTPPTPNNGEVFRYPAMGSTAPVTPGDSTVTVAGLGNKQILEVVIDGRGNNYIILTGTPVNQEVLYETSGSDGVFTWPYAFEPGVSWYCLYQNL